ncbi:hypothetical protein Tco_0914581 [Tanacetum coccineum]
MASRRAVYFFGVVDALHIVTTVDCWIVIVEIGPYLGGASWNRVCSHDELMLLFICLRFVWCLKVTRGLAQQHGIVFVAIAYRVSFYSFLIYFVEGCFILCNWVTVVSESDMWLGRESRHRVCSHHISGLVKLARASAKHHDIVFAGEGQGNVVQCFVDASLILHHLARVG